jgi:hypothetical protein
MHIGVSAIKPDTLAQTITSTNIERSPLKDWLRLVLFLWNEGARAELESAAWEKFRKG